jgi:hypothetical protein
MRPCEATWEPENSARVNVAGALASHAQAGVPPGEPAAVAFAADAIRHDRTVPPQSPTIVPFEPRESNPQPSCGEATSSVLAGFLEPSGCRGDVERR